MRTQEPVILRGRKIHKGEAFPDDWRFGYYAVLGPCSDELKIIASADYGWDHVAVSKRRHPPNWQEMCFVKDIFWDPEETVIQFHPPRSLYINQHPNVLHLWKPKTLGVLLPPRWMVGYYAGWEKDIPTELQNEATRMTKLFFAEPK